MGAAGAGGAVAAAADDPAVGPNLDLQDGRVLGAADGGEGAAAAPATALRRRKIVLLDDGREMGVVAAAWPRLAGLLAAPPPGRGRWVRGRWGQGGADAGLGLAAEELLLTEAELGAELFDLLFEEGLAL